MDEHTEQELFNEEIPLPERIEQLRQKVLTEQVSVDEMKLAIKFLRQGREAAAQARPKKQSVKAQAAQISSSDLLSQLGDIP